MTVTVSTDFGRRLATWIENNLPEGVSWRSFSIEHGIEPTRLIAWRRGATPGLEQLALIAKAFGRSRTDVLVATGFLEANDEATTLVHVPVHDAGEAIDNDPKLPEHDRILLRKTLETLAAVRSERVKTV